MYNPKTDPDFDIPLVGDDVTYGEPKETLEAKAERKND